MVTKNQAIEIVKNYIGQSQDEDKVDKCKDILAKLNSIPEEEFSRIVHRTLGENPDLSAFNDWLMAKLQEPELQGTKFVQLNNFVRNSGSYLVDALEQLKAKIKEGEFEKVETIFAVSDILKLKMLQGYFRDLGFDVREGEEMFRRRFKNPYQASLSRKMLLSEDWEELKEKFMKDRPTITELEGKDEFEK